MLCYVLLSNTEILSHLRFLNLKRREHWLHFQSKHADTRSYTKDMPTCIIPSLPRSAWQEHGIVAPACALENTALTSSRDRSSQHCAAMASQLHAVVASRVANSEGFRSELFQDEESAASRTLQVFGENNAMAGAPANAEFGQGRSPPSKRTISTWREETFDAYTAFFAPLCVPQTCA
jgi:hypothetical protein